MAESGAIGVFVRRRVCPRRAAGCARLWIAYRDRCRKPSASRDRRLCAASPDSNDPGGSIRDWIEYVLSLAVAVAAIALPDSINPSFIAAELFLAGDQHPRRRTITFALAACTVTFLIGFGARARIGRPDPVSAVEAWRYGYVRAVHGCRVVLVAVGTVVWVRRKALGSPGSTSDSGHESHGSPVLLGGGIAELEVLTAFPYFAAIAMIVGSSASDPGKVSLLGLYCVVYTLPLIGIAVVCLVMGDRAEGVLQPEWMLIRWPGIVGRFAAIIGIGLTAYGIVKLSST